MKKSIHILRNQGKIKVLILVLLLGNIIPAFSQDAPLNVPQAASPSVFSNPMFLGLSTIIILLILLILGLSQLLRGAAQYRSEKQKSENAGSSKVMMILLLFLSASNSLFAQAADVPQAAQPVNSYWGLGAFMFYSMITVIALELIILWVLYDNSMDLLGIRELKEAEAAKAEPSLLDKFNASVPLEKEAEIMMDHEYDGIRELDNDLPPWWKYGFYITIFVSIIYMGYYHIWRSGKLQDAEYNEQMAQAKIEMEEYRKNASNLVDENNITLITDATSLESGKKVYIENCMACHGKNAEGGVGPNLTDDYWLHGGSLKDIFKSIKYGWPEKGMKSWEQDLGARQIHEITSYIKSLRGTNPANAKEKQGELYTEQVTSLADSVVVDDSAKVTIDTLVKK